MLGSQNDLRKVPQLRGIGVIGCLNRDTPGYLKVLSVVRYLSAKALTPPPLFGGAGTHPKSTSTPKGLRGSGVKSSWKHVVDSGLATKWSCRRVWAFGTSYHHTRNCRGFGDAWARHGLSLFGVLAGRICLPLGPKMISAAFNSENWDAPPYTNSP